VTPYRRQLAAIPAVVSLVVGVVIGLGVAQGAAAVAEPARAKCRAIRPVRDSSMLRPEAIPAAARRTGVE
jgi:hypothetical protein